ncbi:MAG TPA: hypothetical protein VGI30_06580 [Caulobacteraceae bacterium]
MSIATRLALPAILIATTTAALAASESPANPTAGAQATTGAPATVKANPDDKIVCKTETPIGSRLGGKRVCMKKSDWEAQSLDARRQRDFAPPAGLTGSH